MKTVHKFPFDGGPHFQLALPSDARVVLCALDPNGQSCVWAEVETTALRVYRQFYVKGTGHEVDPTLIHRGSFVATPYVWHVYEAPVVSGVTT